MIFLWLATVALIFAVLGFLAHAFYFSRKDQIEILEKELEGLKTALMLCERESTQAREEVAKTRKLLESAEIQLQQRNGQIAEILATVKQQDEESQLLHEKKSSTVAVIETSVPVPAETREVKIPLWKDNLNNILGMLDKIEKETDE